LLGIALENKNIGIVRYLVVRKRMLLSAEKNLPTDTLMENLDLVLRVLPEGALTEQHIGQEDDMAAYGAFDSAAVDASPSAPIAAPIARNRHSASTSTIDTFDPSGPWSTELAQDFSTINVRGGNGDEASNGSVDDAVSRIEYVCAFPEKLSLPFFSPLSFSALSAFLIVSIVWQRRVVTRYAALNAEITYRGAPFVLVNALSCGCSSLEVNCRAKP
jgi:hypothetical protein